MSEMDNIVGWRAEGTEETARAVAAMVDRVLASMRELSGNRPLPLNFDLTGLNQVGDRFALMKAEMDSVRERHDRLQRDFQQGRRTQAPPELAPQLRQISDRYRTEFATFTADLARRAELEIKAKRTFRGTYDPTPAEKAMFSADPILNPLSSKGRGKSPATEALTEIQRELRYLEREQSALQRQEAAYQRHLGQEKRRQQREEIAADKERQRQQAAADKEREATRRRIQAAFDQDAKSEAAHQRHLGAERRKQERETERAANQRRREDDRAMRGREKYQRDLERLFSKRDEADLGRVVARDPNIEPVAGSAGVYRLRESNLMFERTEAGARLLRNEIRVAEVLEREGLALERINRENTRRAQTPLQAFLGGATSRGFNTNPKMPTMDEALTGLAGTAGNVAKYSALYGALFGALAVAADTIQETKDMADSLTDLTVAMGQTGPPTQDFINQLSDIAALSGGNVGQAMDIAARGIRVFREEVESGAIGQEELATGLNRAATSIALIGNIDIQAAATDIAAASKGFALGADGFNVVADAIAAARESMGGDAGDIARAVASISTVMNQAGFTAAETAQLISGVAAQTGESGQAISTRIARMMDTLSGSTGQRIARELDIDLGQTTREQLQDIVDRLAIPQGQIGAVSADIAKRIRGELAGVGGAREVDVIFGPGFFDRVVAQAQDTAGASGEAAARRLGDLAGMFMRLRGEITELQTQIVQTDLFQPFGVALVAAEKFLSVITNILKVYNSITEALPDLSLLGGPFKAAPQTDTILGFGVTALAGRAAYQRVRGSEGLGSQLRGFFGGGGDDGARAGESVAIGRATAARSLATAQERAAIAANALALAGATEAEIAASRKAILAQAAADTERVAATRAGTAKIAAAENTAAVEVGAAGTRLAASINAAAIGAGGAGAYTFGQGSDARRRGLGGRVSGGLDAATRGLGGVARFAFSPAGLVTALGAGLGASVFNQMRGVTDLRETTQRQAIQAGTDPAKMREAAEKIRSGAANFDASATGLTAFVTSVQRREALKEAEATARQLEKEAGDQGPGASPVDTLGIGVFKSARSVEELTAGLDVLTDTGADAATRMRLFIEAVGASGLTGEQAAKRIKANAPVAATALADTLLDPERFRAAENRAGSRLRETRPGDATWIRDSNLIGQERRDLLGGEGVRGRVVEAAKRAIAAVEPGPDGMLDAAALDQIAGTAIDSLGLDQFGDFGRELRAQLVGDIRKTLAAQQAAAVPARHDPLTPTQGLAQLQGLARVTDEKLKAPGVEGNLDAELAVAIQQVNAARSIYEAIRGKPEELGEAMAALQAAEIRRANIAIQGAEEGRRHEQSLAKTTAQVRAVGQEYFNIEAGAAAALGDSGIPLLIAIMDRGSRRNIDIFTESLKEDLAVLKARRTKAAANIAALQAAGALTGTAGAAAGDYLVGLDRAIAEQGTKIGAVEAASGRSKAPGKGGVFETGSDARDDVAKNAETQRAIDAARRQARVRPGDEIGQALADIQAARAAVADAEQKEGRNSVAYWNAVKGLNQAEHQYRVAVGNKTTAIAQAEAARGGGQVAAARASLVAAQQQLRTATRGTAGWYQALAGYYQAQRGLSDAISAARFTAQRARGDVTDPVRAARIDLAEAQAKLRAARNRGADPDVVDPLVIDVKNKQAAAETAALNQRLKLAEHNRNMGRLSHSAYMSMIQSEMASLRRLGLTTESRREAYRELEAKLKGLNEQLQGQFNLGDIKIPTVYQARRAVGGDGAYAMPRTSNVNQTVSIQIDGADIPSVTRVLTQILGPDVAVNSPHNRKF